MSSAELLSVRGSHPELMCFPLIPKSVASQRENTVMGAILQPPRIHRVLHLTRTDLYSNGERKSESESVPSSYHMECV